MTATNGTARGAAGCSACAAVCCRLTVVLHPCDDIPEHLTACSPEGLRIMKRGADGWCAALDRERMNCSIYEARPSVCARFVMNGPYCKAIRAEYTGPAVAGARHESTA